jgi:hypothetical protein
MLDMTRGEEGTIVLVGNDICFAQYQYLSYDWKSNDKPFIAHRIMIRNIGVIEMSNSMILNVYWLKSYKGHSM